MNILLDTNAYVAFKGGDPAVLEVIRLADEVHVRTVVLGELLAGFALGTREAANRCELSAFLDSPRVTVLSVNEETASFYAAIFGRLRAKARPIPTNDLWLAATALQHGCPLATYDAHFEAVDGLRIVKQPEDLLF
ncbi:MAG: type II toxin-antitoxin system VapC family toxin [Thermoleophilia bacterium]